MKSRRPRKLRGHSGPAVIFMVLGTAIAVSSVFIAANSSNTPKPLMAAEPMRVAADADMVLMPTPVRPIAKGEKLGNVEFTKVSFPKNRFSGEYVAEIDRFKDHVATAQLPKYLPVPLASLTLDGVDGNVVAERIPEGMRAITVRVDAESAVEGWARSGNFVDVLVIVQSKVAGNGAETKVVAQNIRILSAGQSATPLTSNNSAPTPPATVTLLVNQEDALKIKTAANLGKLTFSLRGTGDSNPTLVTNMNQRGMFGGGVSDKANSRTIGIKGHVRGPDGRAWALTDDGRIIRTAEVPNSFQRKPGELVTDDSSDGDQSLKTESRDTADGIVTTTAAPVID